MKGLKTDKDEREDRDKEQEKEEEKVSERFMDRERRNHYGSPGDHQRGHGAHT